MLLLFSLETDSPRSRSYQTSRRTVTGPSERSRSTLSRNGGENSFKEFLWQHIEMALTKGFDDNVGRHPVAANFEVYSNILKQIFKILKPLKTRNMSKK